MMRNLIELRKSSSDTVLKAEVDILMNEAKVKFANLLMYNLINDELWKEIRDYLNRD